MLVLNRFWEDKMNLDKLLEAQNMFMDLYPDGFSSPEMLKIAKKHKMEKFIAFATDAFAKEKFNDPEAIVNSMIQMVSKSTMVSLFEKPKFRDSVKAFNDLEKEMLSNSLFEMLHGNQESGFDSMIEILDQVKLAKWTLVTVFGAYFAPNSEVFIKPTTTKNVISHFELDDVEYKPRPTYAFYKKYRDHINEMKTKVDPTLSPSNAAFLGFLMSCY